jgi:hypothetical protein
VAVTDPRPSTLDTGALIALEGVARGRAAHGDVAVLAKLIDRGPRVRFTVPAVVVAEWWRGQRGPAATLLEGLTIEQRLSEREARDVGLVLARMKKRARALRERLLVIDAIVVVTADDLVAIRDELVIMRKLASRDAVRVFGV